MISLAKPLLEKYGSYSRIATLAYIPVLKVKAILTAEDRPDGLEIVKLCSLAEIDPFKYGEAMADADFQIWLEKNHPNRV